METTTAEASAATLVAPNASGEQRTGLTVAQLLLEYLKLEEAATLIEQALRVARSQPSRAAHLSIPNDVAGACVTDPTNKTNQYTIWFPDAPSRYRSVPSGTDVAAVKRAFGDLSSATRPLLFL